jgi:hypothetical protein
MRGGPPQNQVTMNVPRDHHHLIAGRIISSPPPNTPDDGVSGLRAKHRVLRGDASSRVARVLTMSRFETHSSLLIPLQ